MVEIKNITFAYDRQSRPVLEGFCLRLEPGSVCGLLGKNGTGKSTLLYLMTGLLRPQQGRVLVGGRDVAERRPETLRDVFLVPEEFDLPAVSMKEYVAVNSPFYPRFDRDVLEGCLADFDLPSALRLDKLSMGQRKKAYMSFALATGTRLLLMDEPTNGLDIPSKSSFRKVVATHATDERTIVVSTHQVRDVEMLIDSVAILDGERLLLNAKMADVGAALSFEQRQNGEPTADALYVQPSVYGNRIVCPNADGAEDTPVDLELLFNALQARPDLAQRIAAGKTLNTETL